MLVSAVINVLGHGERQSGIRNWIWEGKRKQYRISDQLLCYLSHVWIASITWVQTTKWYYFLLHAFRWLQGGGQLGVIHRHLSLTQQRSHWVLLVLTLKMWIRKPIFYDVFALLRYYAAFTSNFLPTFRDSRTDRLSRNVGK